MSDAGFDRWEVTWKWNGGEGDDSVEPRPGFTRDLKALSEFCLSKGVRIGYYNTMSGGYWGEGRDLADPAAIAFKRKQIDESTIRKYHSTWQMIDLGEFWWNDKETAYSHPSDNVYRKALAVREYMTDMTRRHPDWVPLTTCELEAPGVNPRAQCVDLMLIAENGQAGSYCRTDNASGARPQSPRSNLSDAFNFIGLMPLEAYVGVYGESGTDPWPEMFTPACYYSTLLSGCSTFYSDVRRWTPNQAAAERINLCVRAPDVKPYRLSVYLLDYDRCGRTHQVALHGANGTLLDTQIAEATATAKGVYLSWTVTGSVELEVTKTTGLNAAASAVFVDPE